MIYLLPALSPSFVTKMYSFVHTELPESLLSSQCSIIWPPRNSLVHQHHLSTCCGLDTSGISLAWAQLHRLWGWDRSVVWVHGTECLVFKSCGLSLDLSLLELSCIIFPKEQASLYGSFLFSFSVTFLTPGFLLCFHICSFSSHVLILNVFLTAF